jgi:hypothetical protein
VSAAARSPDEGPAPEVSPGVRRWVGAALVAGSLAIAVAWAALIVLHVDDRAMVDHVAGVRMALARASVEGTLYPELYADGRYGGTRFMPLPIVVHGLVARVTGEVLVSGKIVSAATMLALVAVVAMLLRRLGAPGPVAVALPALILATGTGLSASMNMRGDVLPVLLQLGAVWLIAADRRPGATVGAAGLAALALVAKLSAVWAPIAIVVWLVGRDRRRLVVFVAAYMSLAVALLGILIWITEGRLLVNVFGLSTAGITGPRSIALAPYRFLHLVVQEATPMWAVAPLAALGLLGTRRGWSIYVVSLAVSLLVVLVVLSDVGTGANQLIDPIVLAAVVVGEAVGRSRRERDRISDRVPAQDMVLRVALLWAVAIGLVVTLVPRLQTAAERPPWLRPNPLADVADVETAILSEDPYVPLSLGQPPVILDPFMLPRLAEREPEAIPDLVRRIERQEFEFVVLVEPLEPVNRPWWTELSLGEEVVGAVARAYEPVGSIDGYHVYQPRAGDEDA